jgi:hypothetical protein
MNDLHSLDESSSTLISVSKHYTQNVIIRTFRISKSSTYKQISKRDRHQDTTQIPAKNLDLLLRSGIYMAYPQIHTQVPDAQHCFGPVTSENSLKNVSIFFHHKI